MKILSFFLEILPKLCKNAKSHNVEDSFNKFVDLSIQILVTS